MNTVHTASTQWATRPADERFTSLTNMLDVKRDLRQRSGQKVVSTGVLMAAPTDATHTARLAITGANGAAYVPTHWAFGQLAGLAGAPAGYLRTLPAALAADALNYGLKIARDRAEVGVLLQRPEPTGERETFSADAAPAPSYGSLVAATGPKYGRIWDADVIGSLVDNFGDGVTGRFRVPGEFGQRVDVTKANTTLYAGDRDMFVFLADEDNRVEIPGAGRGGSTESLARGLFIWNSEVGSKTFGVASFLYRYVCCNRIVWGAQQHGEITFRHSSLAPERFLREIQPALASYANGATTSVVDAVKAAQNARIETDVTDWLATRFGSKSLATSIQAAHMLEEGRPVETLWDAAQGATAVARSITWQDERVALERTAGEVMSLAA